MRNKTYQSLEERREAIAKEIEAISSDIERVRSLVCHDQETAVSEVVPHEQNAHVRVPARAAAGLT
jgi:hypothetical protein